VFRWGGDRGSKETVFDSTARTEPPGRSSPTLHHFFLSTTKGLWYIKVQQYEDFEARVLTVRRRYLDGECSEAEGRGVLG
jgi:hypothetical protein